MSWAGALLSQLGGAGGATGGGGMLQQAMSQKAPDLPPPTQFGETGQGMSAFTIKPMSQGPYSSRRG